MANKLYEESSIQNIADAIREKNGTQGTYKVSEMASAITALDASGGSSSEPLEKYLTFYTTHCGISNVIAFSNTVSGSINCYLPTNAVNIRGKCKFRYEARNSNGDTLGYTDYFEKMIVSEADYTKTPRSGNPEYSLYSFGTYSLSYSDSNTKGLIVSVDTDILSYDLPGAYIKDDILYLEENTKAIYSTNSYELNVKYPWYIRGIDMRKSKMTVLQDFYGGSNSYLEFVYLPETLTEISLSSTCAENANLKELHFSSLVPPTVSYSDYLDTLPATCKIYVPVGTLDTYKAAENYPSPDTHIYIEE